MPHTWKFFRAGGVDQVVLATGADVMSLDQLDPKLWVALSMPTKGVEIEPRTLELLDPDKDGHVRQPDIVAAVVWLRGIYADPDQLLKGGSELPLVALADGPVKAGAVRILTDLGKPSATAITVDDVADSGRIFAETRFNGDGVIPATAAGDDLDLLTTIEQIIASHGSVPDRSGKPGIDLPRIEAFFTEAKALLEWQGRPGPAELPLGAGTAAAGEALRAVKAKVDDYYVRCRLAAIDPRAADALRGSDADLASLASRTLSVTAPGVEGLPLAAIGAGKPLPLDAGVNPAWLERIRALASAAVLPGLGGGRVTLAEDDWSTLNAKLAAHEAWFASKPTGLAGSHGLDRLKAIVEAGYEARLRALIEQDLAVKPEFDQLVDVEKLVRLQRDFLRILRNFVNFSEFYAQRTSVFQTGRLYLDARGCNLVVDVVDPAKHGTLAIMAGTYLAYCDCTRAGEKRTIAAALTTGDSDNVMVGRNGVFVDVHGKDWDATVTKIVDNPISIRQAFWAPYKKLARWIEEQVAKRATAAQGEADSKLAAAAAATANVDKTPHAEPPKKVDVGTVAAIGVAIGGIGAMVTGILAVFLGLGWWMPFGIASIVLLISTPSMLLAYLKLRTRNLGPLLDANGWAINGRARINVPFGKALTDLAVLPRGAHRATHDPYAEKQTPWKTYVTLLIVVALAVAWYLGKLDRYLPKAATSVGVLGDAAPAARNRILPDVVEPAAAPAAPAAPAAEAKP
jgi:hypothetical protein